ncbi:transmembrane emp24 domain-containing protein bai [Drosophila mojavensis]|uniref:GOLD domain-containing protein n=1 Tax=Drosophila mojavensis TaxID=7230 RepID=B4L435_DROMO|nr:transmembrane emp24 domain-containing protein bai [Drosophila mojavensis]EDW07313.1 uncharacterized protein Dmoj_GI15674 [Drosophila mojavensis]
MLKSYIVLLTILGCVPKLHGIRFHLTPNGRKCLKEDMQANQLVKGEYEVSDVPGQIVNYVVRDSKGHILSQKERITKGKFSFTAEVYETYEICFTSRGGANQPGANHEVSLITKKGIEAKRSDALGEAAKLKPIEADLKRLEVLSDSIVLDFELMRKREEEMRDTNEKTNSRVLIYSVFSICCLLGLATWQVLYLRRFFRIKKLID